MCRILNRRQIAEHCEISLPTIDAWVSKGCPVVQRGSKGKPWRFDTDAVDGWRAMYCLEKTREPSRDVEGALAKAVGLVGIIAAEMAVRTGASLKIAYALEQMVSVELSIACQELVLGKREFRFGDLCDQYWKAFHTDWSRLASLAGETA